MEENNTFTKLTRKMQVLQGIKQVWLFLRSLPREMWGIANTST